MPERRPSVYDPARDLFTQAEKKQEGYGSENALQSPSPEPSNDRKRSLADNKSEGANSDLHDSTDNGASKLEPPSKRTKTSPANTPTSSKEPRPLTAASLSSISRVKKKPTDSQQKPNGSLRRSPDTRRRSRSPQRRDRRPSPAYRRSRSPLPIRDPTPPPRSPPRQRKRPGAAARVNKSDVDEVKRRQEERERAEQEAAKAEASQRGNADFVRQHYNAVPQRGRQWRATNSKIKGLRSFNNWIKSAIIQKFSPDEVHIPGSREVGINGAHQSQKGLLVLDIGCGKGGDLQKWKSAPQRVDLYVGFDPADVSITQAKERFAEMQQQNRRGYRPQPLFDAHFFVRDCFGEWLGHVPLVREVGIDPTAGPDGHGGGQPRHGGFDVVSMMFCMHYAFESEAKARGMLKNVAGSLKKGGRFLGVIPNSDVLTARALEFNKAHGKATPANPAVQAADEEDDDWDPERPASGRPGSEDDDDDDWDPEKPSEAPAETEDDDAKKAKKEQDEPKEEGEIESQLEWGNEIYRVKFPGKVPADGVFRPNYGWKYFYFLEEAIDQVPEYVVPWEGFRYLASQYNLELQYRKPFTEIWDAEKDDPILGPLSERMGVRGRDRGPLLVSDEEMEAANFYHAFCFYKT